MKPFHDYYIQIFKLVRTVPFPATEHLRTLLYLRINQKERYKYLILIVPKAPVTPDMQQLSHVYGGSKKKFVLF
jgi:hypothetical protein